MKKRLVFTVTNDLSYDQRMIRICRSLSQAGYAITLVGRRKKDSIPLARESFEQKRLPCFFQKGKLFYVEYNFRLFFYLLLVKADLFCAIDLDSILPVYFASTLRRKYRVYDAHELFCEMKEIVTRPGIYRLWKRVERFSVPRFPKGYTVNQPIAAELEKMYGVQYAVIRNFPVKKDIAIPEKPERFILYQGAVNEGRCFESLIPAMKQVNARLVICGTGNFMDQAKKLVEELGLGRQVEFRGNIPPEPLRAITLSAWAGITLFENRGRSNYLSLGNRFADYVQAGIPQVCVDYPAYHELNKIHQVAVLVEMTDAGTLAKAINRLLNDEEWYHHLQQQCLVAREEWNWQHEEQALLAFYNTIFT